MWFIERSNSESLSKEAILVSIFRRLFCDASKENIEAASGSNLSIPSSEIRFFFEILSLFFPPSSLREVLSRV
jgi:hypothetical protein